MPKYNRLKILLAERDRNASWLARKLGLTVSAVTRWCNNQGQPRVAMLYQIADVLDVTVHDILVARLPEGEEQD